MDRGNTLIVAVIIAAIAFFGLRFLSAPQHSPSSTEFARSGSHQEGWIAEEEAGGAEPGGGFARKGTLRENSSPSQRLRHRLAGGTPGAGGATSPGARRRAETVAGGSSTRGVGAVGESASTRRDGRRSSGIAVADTVGGNPPGSRRSARESAREELVQTLALQPPPSGGLLAGDGSANPDAAEEVVLEVSSTDDTAKAETTTDVHDPKYGDDGIELTPDSELAFPNAGNINGAEGSMSFEITPNWAGVEETNNTLAQIRQPNEWNNRMELVKNGKYLRFVVTDNTGEESDVSHLISSWAPGERHEVIPTWGNGEIRLYVDGQLVGRDTYKGQLEIPPGTPMQLGSAYANYKGFDGIIHKTTVWGRARSEEEIASGY